MSRRLVSYEMERCRHDSITAGIQQRGLLKPKYAGMPKGALDPEKDISSLLVTLESLSLTVETRPKKRGAWRQWKRRQTDYHDEQLLEAHEWASNAYSTTELAFQIVLRSCLCVADGGW